MRSQDLDRLLVFLHALTESQMDDSVPMLAAEPLLAREWLSPEEDAAWADL